MEQRFSLYSILISYANKNNSPYIDPDAFITFLEGYAKKNAEEQPELQKWTQGTGVKFRTELAELAEEGKCELLSDTPNGRIYMPHFNQKLLERYYSNLDGNADLPFPSEESLGVIIPNNQVQYLAVGPELSDFFEEPIAEPPIISVSFPNDVPSALALSSLIPRRFIEACLLKIRNYIREGSNKEYAQNKLNIPLMGKESLIREMLNKIQIRPLDCYGPIVEGGEFSYLFWAHFCVLIKNDIKKKNELLSGDIAAIQSVYIIETLNSYYKNHATKEKEKELAFKRLEVNLGKPPFLYTLEQIINFTHSDGMPLLGQYSREELAEQIEKLANESTDDKLPELLVLSESKNEQYYVLKSKMLLLCYRQISEAREKVKKAISKHWLKLLKNYQKEPSMDSDKEFEKILYRYTRRLCPMLNFILEDPKLYLVYSEMEQIKEIPISSRIFVNGVLIPYSALFLLKRKDLLEDTRIILPFWYGMPFLVSIITFFKKMFRNKKDDTAESSSDNNQGDEVIPEKDESQEIQSAAKKVERDMVPQNYTIDSYLEELKIRWVRLIDKTARENLVEDVNSLIRDNLRQTLRVQKHYKITQESLVQLADTILTRTPSLNSLGAKDSLRTYIELYLVKLLLSYRTNFSINEAS